MVVQHNLSAMNANRYLGINNSKLSKSLEKLSSGYAINRAGDNAAGLAVSEKMRSQIAGMTQAVKNAQDGISMVQTFEGALTETDSILQRMKTLANQMANGSYDDPVDRTAAQQEFLQLNDELDQIADTDFNGVVVLNGGVMSDGTTADGNGLIDYANTTRGAMQLGSTGGYTMGIGKDGYNGNADGKTITFTAKVDATTKDVTWTASEGTAGSEKNGGFTYEGASFNIDTTKVVNGDTVVVKFAAATNDIVQTSETTGTNTNMGTLEEANDGDFTAASLAIEAGVVTSQEMADAVNALHNLTVSTDFAVGGTTATNIKVNNQAKPTTATNATIATIATGKTLELDQNNIIYYNDGTTKTKIATLTPASMADAPKTGGTVTTTILLSKSSFTPAAPGGITIVDPGASVSASNAFNKSEAQLTYKSSITLQTGARTKDAVNFTFKYNSNAIGKLDADLNCTAKGLGTDKLNLSSQEAANYAIDKIDQAINKVSLVRGTFGAIQNRLEHKIDNLNVSVENLTSAESQIRDTNMPQEMMNFTKQQILAQASQSMLAQANQLPQGVLSLLQ